MKRLLSVILLGGITATAQGFDTRINNAGMLYLSLPFNSDNRINLHDSVFGLRYGLTEFSSDPLNSSLSDYRRHPAMLEMEFARFGYLHDESFGLREFKLNGISAMEKTYIQGNLVGVALTASQLMLGAAAVGTVAMVAASTSEDSSEAKPVTTSSASKDTDDSPDRDDDDVAGHDDDEHPDEDHVAGHDDDDDHDEDHDDLAGHDDDEGHDDVAGHDDDEHPEDDHVTG